MRAAKLRQSGAAIEDAIARLLERPIGMDET